MNVNLLMEELYKNKVLMTETKNARQDLNRIKAKKP